MRTTSARRSHCVTIFHSLSCILLSLYKAVMNSALWCVQVHRSLILLRLSGNLRPNIFDAATMSAWLLFLEGWRLFEGWLCSCFITRTTSAENIAIVFLTKLGFRLVETWRCLHMRRIINWISSEFLVVYSDRFKLSHLFLPLESVFRLLWSLWLLRRLILKLSFLIGNERIS